MPLIDTLTKEAWDKNLDTALQLLSLAKQRILSCTTDPRVKKLIDAIEIQIRKLINEAFKDKDAIVGGVVTHKKIDQDAHRKVIAIINALIQTANRIKPEDKPATVQSDQIYADLRSLCLTRNQPLYAALGGGRFDFTSHPSFTKVKNAILNDIDKTLVQADQKFANATTAATTDPKIDYFAGATELVTLKPIDKTPLQTDQIDGDATTVAAADSNIDHIDHFAAAADIMRDFMTKQAAYATTAYPTATEGAAGSGSGAGFAAAELPSTPAASTGNAAAVVAYTLPAITPPDSPLSPRSKPLLQHEWLALVDGEESAAATLEADSKSATAAFGSATVPAPTNAVAPVPKWLADIDSKTQTLVLYNDDILSENQDFRAQLKSLNFFADLPATHFHHKPLKKADFEGLAITLNSMPNVRTLAINNIHNAQDLAVFLRQNTTVQILVACIRSDNQNASAIKEALKHNRTLTKLYFVGSERLGGSYTQFLAVLSDIIDLNHALELIDFSRSWAIAFPKDFNELLPPLANNRSLTHLETSGERWGSIWGDKSRYTLSQLLFKKIPDYNRARKSNTKFTHELTFEEVEPHLPFNLEKSFVSDSVWTLRDNDSHPWNLHLEVDSPWLTPAFSPIKHLLVFPADFSRSMRGDDKSDSEDDTLELLESFLPYLSSLTSITISDSAWGLATPVTTLLRFVNVIPHTTAAQLSMLDCVVNHEVIAAISTLLSANQLEKLQITSRTLDDKLTTALSKPLETNTTLQELKLGTIGNTGVIALCNMLRTNWTLLTLEISGPLDLTALKALRSAITVNRSLCYLKFSYDCSNADGKAAGEIVKDIDRQLDRNIALRNKSTANWRFLAVLIAVMRVNNTEAFPAKMMVELSTILHFSSSQETDFPACVHSSGQPVSHHGYGMSPRLRSHSSIDTKRSSPPMQSPPASPSYAAASRMLAATWTSAAAAGAASAISPLTYPRSFSPSLSPLSPSVLGQAHTANTYMQRSAVISAGQAKAVSSDTKTDSKVAPQIVYGKKRDFIGRLQFRNKLSPVTFQNESKSQLALNPQHRITDKKKEPQTAPLYVADKKTESQKTNLADQVRITNLLAGCKKWVELNSCSANLLHIYVELQQQWKRNKIVTACLNIVLYNLYQLRFNSHLSTAEHESYDAKVDHLKNTIRREILFKPLYKYHVLKTVADIFIELYESEAAEEFCLKCESVLESIDENVATATAAASTERDYKTDNKSTDKIASPIHHQADLRTPLPPSANADASPINNAPKAKTEIHSAPVPPAKAQRRLTF